MAPLVQSQSVVPSVVRLTVVGFAAGVDTMVRDPLAPPAVAQVPSPLQKVEDDAPVPLFKFPTGRFPVTPPFAELARLIGGISADTNARNVGATADPVVGPAKTAFADCVRRDKEPVPPRETVTPLELNTVPSPSIVTEEFARLAFGILVGRSATTRARNVGVADGPELGPANTVFTSWVFKDGARVPEVVIGDPVTAVLKTVPSPVMATEVTVPLPPPEPLLAAVIRPLPSTVMFALV